MENLKKAVVATLLTLASPIAFSAIAIDDHYVIVDALQNRLVTFDPLRNDTYDPNSTAPFTNANFTLVQGSGTIQVTSGVPTFESTFGFSGTAEIQYTVQDNAGTGQASIFIDVQESGDFIQAVPDTYYVPMNSNTVTFQVRSNDKFDEFSSMPLVVTDTSSTTTQGGLVGVTPLEDDSVDYSPPANFIGTDSFTYTIEGPSGARVGTVTVYVGAIPGQSNIAMSGNLTPEEARTYAVIIEACDQGIGNLPCNEIENLTPEQQKLLAQEVSGRHAKLQARAMRQLTRQQASNINVRLKEIRAQRNQISIDGLNLAIMGDSLPLGPALQGSLNGGSAGDGSLATPWGTFINGKISMGESNKTASRPSYDQDAYSLTFGVDYRFSDKAVLGAAAGFGDSDTNFTSTQGSQNAKSFSLVSFGNYYPAENLYIDGLAMWTQGKLDVDRQITVGLIQQSLASDTDSQQLTAATSIGYEFNHQRWQSSLYGRLEYSDLIIDGYTETGGSLALQVGKQDTHSFTSALGTQVGYAFSWSRGVIVPSLELEYIRESSGDFNINNQFAGAVSAGSFSISADEPDKEYMSLAASASAVFSGGRSAFFRYETLLMQNDYDFSSYSVGFRTEF